MFAPRDYTGHAEAREKAAERADQIFDAHFAEIYPDERAKRIARTCFRSGYVSACQDEHGAAMGLVTDFI
jgi:hypothetical protein